MHCTAAHVNDDINAESCLHILEVNHIFYCRNLLVSLSVNASAQTLPKFKFSQMKWDYLNRHFMCDFVQAFIVPLISVKS